MPSTQKNYINSNKDGRILKAGTMVLGIQVFGIVFGAFMLYMSFLQWKKRQFTLNEWAFWSVFALAFSFISLFPDIINPITAALKLERKLDLFIILGFMFLIAATFYSYRIVRHTQKQVEDMVRQIAIERAQQPGQQGTKRNKNR